MSARIIKGPEFKFPVDESTLGQFFFNYAQKYSERICHVDGTSNKTETYGSVKLRSTRVAIALQKKGISSADNITLCSANTLDNTIPLIAAAYLGAKISNLESSLSVRHTKYLLSIVTPKIIFVEEAAVTLIEESLVGCDFHPEIIVFGNSTKYSVFADFDQPQENENEFQPVKMDPDELAFMLFSSGTTGLPKAICRSHRSLMCFALQLYQLGITERVFHFSNFYWATAIMVLTSCFKTGTYRIFVRNATPEDVFRVIETYKAAYIFSIPSLTYKLTSFENATKYDTSSLKVFLCTGTPMAVSQLQKMNQLFPKSLTLLSYGMNEAGFATCFDFIHHDRKFILPKLASAGTVVPGFLLKVVNSDTEELLGPHQKGEIRLKGPSVMTGYYRNDHSEAFDKDGFLKTGDVGYYDEDDCVYVVERIKEMFRYQWWQILPSSIEAVLLEHPGIADAVVFGLPGREDDEVPSACVVLKEGFSLSEDEIDEFLKSRVSEGERLRGGVTFMQSLPKTPSGKTVRREAKEFVMKSKGL